MTKDMRLRTNRWLAGLAVVMTVTSVAHSAIIKHRYSFEGDGSDSFGGPAGVLSNGAEIFEGALYTPIGTQSAFLLPAQSLIDLGTSFSVESWYTATHPGPGTYLTIFGFGTHPNFSFVAVRDRAKYPEALPNYEGLSSLSIIDGDAITKQTLLPGLKTDLDQLTQFLATYDAETRTASLYINGELISSSVLVNDTTFDLPSLAAMEGFKAAVGGQNPWNDPSLGGNTSDFRLYSGAVSAEQVAQLYLLGPDASNAAILAVVPEPQPWMLIGLGLLMPAAVATRRAFDVSRRS